MEVATLTSSLLADRALIEDYLDRMLAEPGGVAGGVALEAMRYAVLGPGQRLRPLLALRTARMLRAEVSGTLRAAAAVELVHCASLVIDDLPCMDNSTLRRDRPCTHVAFGEPVAVLASFAMIALAARCLLEGDLSDDELVRLVRYQRRLLATLDWSSLIAGQAMDLQLTGETRLRALAQISELKTVPLFQLAMHAGAVFAPVSVSTEAALDRFGREFGMVYQMADDYLDGDDRDWQALAAQFDRTRECARSFGADSDYLEDMLDYLHDKVTR